MYYKHLILVGALVAQAQMQAGKNDFSDANTNGSRRFFATGDSDSIYDQRSKQIVALAAQKKWDEIKKEFAKGACLNQHGTRGNTPLLFAITQGNVEAVTWLLEHGADARAKNHDNKTCFALAKGNGPILSLLKEHKKIINNEICSFLTFCKHDTIVFYLVMFTKTAYGIKVTVLF